jgi:cytochrome c-type biogenesis protein CcmE
MKAKHQRLVLVALAALALTGATALAVSALQETQIYFYMPSEVTAKAVEPGTPMRLGGLVETGSVGKLADGVTLTFRVSDATASVPVHYKGLMPDLFREGQGVITEGSFDAAGVFTAKTVLARHDENYVPKEVADALKKQGEWRPTKPPGAPS